MSFGTNANARESFVILSVVRFAAHRMRATVGRVLLVLMVSAVTPVRASEEPASAPKVEKVLVAMSDGVRLATNVYLPKGEGPWPAILTRTPYNKDKDLVPSLGFTDAGYAVVVQNVRGTGASEGVWDLFGSDGWGGPGRRDGIDTVEWIREQPWSDGKLGVIGFSGSGIPALMLVAAAPEGLLCAFANATSDNLYDTFYGYGAFRANTAEVWPQAKPVLGDIVAHPNYDDYWRQRDARSRAGQANVPVYLTGAWSDLFQRNTVAFFAAIHGNGLPRSQGRCKLVMAPGAHAAPPGALTFPDRSKTNIDERVGSMRDWFDYWLKGIKNGIAGKPAVALFMMGDESTPGAGGNEWLFYDHWPPPFTPVELYLRQGNALERMPPPADGGASTYDYDPANPVPTLGGNNLMPPSGPHDMRPVESRPDVLLFETPPLPGNVALCGPVTVTLYVASTAVDTDFAAFLTDVYPDGRSMVMLDNLVRARHRKTLDRESFLEPGRVYEVTIDLWDTCLTVAPGHRIRLLVTSSNAPRFEPNPNTGEPFRRHTASVVATNTVFHDALHPSRLTLPLLHADQASSLP